MTLSRDANLQILLDHAEAAIMAQAHERARAAARLVFGRLSSSIGREAVVPATGLPAGRVLDAVYSDMAAQKSPLPELASALMALEPRLNWTRRSGADPADQPFFDGHANAVIIGRGGIEEREDVWVGVTAMSPDILYRDHSHPPEEVYLALSEGEWWNAEMDWTAPGPGGIIYNPPGILHAMRSGPKPFLALWLLPIG
jgi:hypothetical protein